MKELEIFPGTNNGRERHKLEQEKLEQIRYNSNTKGRARKSSKQKKKPPIKFYAGCLAVVLGIGALSFSSAVGKQYEENLNEAGYSLEYVAVGSSDLDQVIVDSNGDYVSKNAPGVPTRADAREEVIDNIFTPKGR